MIQLNGKTLTFASFPNGETKVNGDEILELAVREYNQLVFKFENNSDLIHLMFVKNYLDKHGLDSYLIITYMPYSRMDRVEGNSVFTLKYVADFINHLRFLFVIVVDPHSDVTPALLDRVETISLTEGLLEEVMRDINFDISKDYLFFPDAGAQKRYGKIKGYQHLVGYKERDFETGRINNLQVVGNVKESGFKVVIVDDLCSYGGTFVLSAEKLKELGASEIYLAVTHCEDSIYKGKIFDNDLISKVFTTNTILNGAKNDRILVCNMEARFKKYE